MGGTDGTYIYTAGQAFARKHQVESELVLARLEFAVGTEHLLVPEETGVSISEIFELLPRLIGGSFGRVRSSLVQVGGTLVDADEAMERDGQVGDADGFDYCQDDVAFDIVADRVLAMGVGGMDVEIGKVARARSDGQREATEKRAARLFFGGLGRVDRGTAHLCCSGRRARETWRGRWGASSLSCRRTGLRWIA